MFQRLQEDIWKRQLSNCQERDRAVLTMATAMLGISVTFIDKVVNIVDASHIWILVTAWAGFILAIVTTLWSFHASQIGLEKQLELGRRYYIDEDEGALSESNKKGGNWGKFLTDSLNLISSVSFVIAVVLLVVFIAVNIMQRRGSMNRQNNSEAHGAGALSRGAGVPNLVPRPAGHTNFGASVPAIQPVASHPQSTPPAQGNGNSHAK